MIKPLTRIAYWLLPAAKEEEALQALIDRLAERLGTPRFAPHVTLLVRPAGALDQVESDLEPISQLPVLTLQTDDGLRWSRHYNRALVQPLALSPPLADLVSRLAPDSRLPAGYDPHLSLHYGDLDEPTGRQLCHELQLPMRTLTCDRVAAVAIGPQTRSAADIAAWHPLATISLKK